MNLRIWLISVIVFCGISCMAQEINIVSTYKLDEKIIINYNIFGAKYDQQFNVSLYVSNDNKKTFTGPLREVVGDVGEGVTKGKRSIAWDVMKEKPFVSDELIFKVEAEISSINIKKSLLLQYVGNTVTPLGVRIGLIGKTGFYIEARATPNFNQNTIYSYTGDYIDNFNRSGYYEFSGKTVYSATSFIGGITLQTALNSHFYLGAGYGKQYYLAEFNIFDYASDSVVKNNWALSETEKYEGIELDGGMIFHFGKVALSLGVTSINLRNINFSGGLGIVF